MFCFKCGKSIADDSAFCPHCGTKVNASEGIVSSNHSSQSVELDRKALRIYLRNVLSLECIVHKLTEQATLLTKKMKDIKSGNYYRKTKIKYHRGETFQFFYDGKTYFVLTGSDGGNIYYSILDTCSKRKWVDIEEIIPNLNKKETWLTQSQIKSDKVYGGISIKIDRKKQQNALKKEFLQHYKEFKEQAPIEYEKNCKTISELDKKFDIVYGKWQEAKTLLDKAYQINIVPGMFRYKPYAIYYLYDLIATSNIAFDLAILNCNLEEIKSKLDTVIEKQQEVIINQIKTIAQNEELCRQTSEMLNKLADIEVNTSNSAKYSKMAASNTATMMWIMSNKV